MNTCLISSLDQMEEDDKLTNPWKNTRANAATFVFCLNKAIGIKGYLATRASLYTKAKIIKPPTTSNTMTFVESQGKRAPPKLSPRRIMDVKPRKVRIPNQSTAFMPSMKDVCSWRMSRNIRMRMAAKPEMGRLM